MNTALLSAVDLFGVRPAVPPLLKWAGGKSWRLARRLGELYAPHRARRLVEPFCGGVSVALALRPDAALLNDKNSHVVNLYQQIQQEGLPVTIPMANDEALYYRHRDRFNALSRSKTDQAETAQLLYYLNRTGFNGLCRFNSSGAFNVPFGRHKTITYRTHFDDYRTVFTDWTFTSTDFAQVPLVPGDFVYADPPYDDGFDGYDGTWQGWRDQERLAHWLAQHDGPVVVSNLATDRVRALYTNLGFSIALLTAPRRISCDGNRASVTELLATRNCGNTYTAKTSR